MLAYIIIFLLVAVMALTETYIIGDDTVSLYVSRQRRNLNICLILVLIFFSGTRLIGGSDYYWYENAYKNVPLITDFFNSKLLDSNHFLRTLDKGYLLLNSIFKTAGISFYGYCLIEACFFYSCLYYGLKKYCKNYSLLLVVFLAKCFFYNTFISMRQSITIAVFFLCLPLIQERKAVKYAMACAVCLLVHWGAVIMIAIFFVSYIKTTREFFLKWLIVFSPFALFEIIGFNVWQLASGPFARVVGIISPVLGNKVNYYFSSGGSGISWFYLCEYLLVALLVYFNYEKIGITNSKTRIIIQLFMALWPLLTVFGSVEIITREKDYFIMSYGLLICYLVNSSKGIKRYALVLGCIVLCAFEFFRFIVLFDGGGLIPYQSWLF